MTTVTNGSRATGSTASEVPGPRAMPVAPRVPTPKGRRNPSLLALGVALIAVGALAAVWMVNAAGDRTPVVVMLRDVPFGAVVTSADVGTADVSAGPGVSTIAAADVDTVVGSVAATNLTTGSLLNRGELTTTAPPNDGDVLVAVAVPATRMPAGGLQAGDRVLVVEAPAPNGAAATGPLSTIPATVVRVGPADVNGVSVVDVTVATGDGPALATWSAGGDIALVVQPRAG
jgi:hypothetical protein